MPELNDGDAAILCIRRRSIRVVAGRAGAAGRVLHVKFLGDLAVLEIAAQGFERPLLTLVREGEEPRAGREVAPCRRSRERAGVSAGSGSRQ